MKIYDFPLSPNCRKVRAVVYELGIEAQFVPVNLFKGEQNAPEIVKLNPNTKAPILVDGDFVLWESNAIIQYLADGSALLPTTRRERADVTRWCEWQTAHLGPAIRKVAFERVVKPMTGQGPADPKEVEAGQAEYDRFAKVLDTSLENKEYVAGRLSIADFALASFFSAGVTAGLEAAPYSKINAWLDRVLSRTSMKRVLADVQAAMPR